MEVKSGISSWLARPVGRIGLIALVGFVCFAPAWLFADPLGSYRLYRDDFRYIAYSRNGPRTLAHLFEPHNTHIVPAWRILTWLLCVVAGKMANLQAVLATSAYSALAATMLLTGRLVARETGRTVVGLLAMIGVGTTALMESAGTWYSAGQTLWAGLGILASLWYLQGWRRSGGAWRLVAAVAASWLAAGFWTIGHAAGPVGAVYLWADGRPRCRRAAWVPLAGTLVAVAIAMTLGGSRINATVSFGGRTTLEAARLDQGISHTLQAIPEDLIFGNLGLTTVTDVGQGAVMTLGLAAAWVVSCRRRGRPNPLECAGAALVIISFLVEWTVRGYLPFSSLRGIVPWYDTIPDIGFVLFVAGWWSGHPPGPPRAIVRLSRTGAMAAVVFQVALIVLHQPRVEALFEETLPGLTADEVDAFPISKLQRLRAVYMASERARWQHDTWKRLDQAEAVARRLHIGRKDIGRVFGRIEAPDLPPVYDAADMLDLPWTDTETRDAVIREALRPWVTLQPDPAPPGSALKGTLDLMGPSGPTPPGPSGR